MTEVGGWLAVPDAYLQHNLLLHVPAGAGQPTQQQKNACVLSCSAAVLNRKLGQQVPGGPGAACAEAVQGPQGPQAAAEEGSRWVGCCDRPRTPCRQWVLLPFWSHRQFLGRGLSSCCSTVCMPSSAACVCPLCWFFLCCDVGAVAEPPPGANSGGDAAAQVSLKGWGSCGCGRMLCRTMHIFVALLCWPGMHQ